MNKKLFQTWHDTLRLWFRLSITSGTDIEDFTWGSPASEFKNWILCKKLKLGYRENGCPFCHKFFNTINCPMGVCNPNGDDVACYSYSYNEWEMEINGLNYHDPRLARKFLVELWKLWCEQT